MRVSNHAILRYVERILGVDVEAIRQEILVAARHDNPDREKLGIEGDVVTTVLGDGMKRWNQDRKHG